MRICRRCMQPDTRPGIVFDDEGICPPCRFAEEHERIDWAARRRELEGLAAFGREKNVSGYDCIIGVSGGKDSTRQAMYARDELGLKPLLVSCIYPPEQVTPAGVHNISNLIALGFDTITVSPRPGLWKAFMREGFFRHGNYAKAPETALYACLPRLAIAYHIPLVLLGENPAISIGAMEVQSSDGDANRMKNANTLSGVPECVMPPGGVIEQDLYWYRYPSDDHMRAAGLRIVYLGFYIKDFNRFANSDFALAHGLMGREDEPGETGHILATEALDNDFVVINQYFKYLKHGFGKVTDHTSELIRLGLMAREEAVELVKRYDGRCGQRYIDRFCRYMGITREQFHEVAERYRNLKLWERDAAGTWRVRELERLYAEIGSHGAPADH